MRHAVVLALAVVVGCDGPGVVAPDRRTVGFGGGAPALSQQVVGAWRRTLFFLDDFGFAHSVETTWRFATDGSAVRAIVTRNLTAGLADVQLTVARWSVSGAAMTIDFVSPPGIPLVLDLRFESSERMVLAGQAYVRLVE